MGGLVVQEYVRGWKVGDHECSLRGYGAALVCAHTDMRAFVVVFAFVWLVLGLCD